MRIDLVRTDEERLACFEVLRELRPALVRERFLDDLARMAGQGFALAALWDPDVRAVAGFRPMEMFSTGPILYVDDLVTAAAHRGKKYGAALLSFLNGHALARGCRFLELDSGLQRLDAHRFYRREGLEDVALHFSRPTGSGERWKI
ncbi:MAG: GNAT family N-acetyltransferase [Archangium sp.]|nr:GNAT family N-acetyltransferase [Archangium sp.]